MSPKKNQAVNEFNQQVKPVSLWADAWKRLRKNRMALAGLWIAIIFFAVTVLAPVLPMLSYKEQNLHHTNLPPSFRPAGEVALVQAQKRIDQIQVLVNQGRSDLVPELDKSKAEYVAVESLNQTDPAARNVYILGTDYLGRDLLARTIYGGRISILIGVVYGAIAGYIGGRTDNIMMRIVDIIYGLPYMLIVIILMALFSKEGQSSVFILFIAIAMVSWLTEARVVRGQIISLKNSEFVEAAKSMGAGTGRIIFKHLLPNTLGIIIIFATLNIPGFIMNESFLSFLGLGVSAPDASWGTLVSEGVQGLELSPWRLLVPATAMTIFLFAMNFLGDGLRDALDPQSKNRT